MLQKLLPIGLALVGAGVGIGGGLALRPDPETAELISPCGDVESAVMAHEAAEAEGETVSVYEYVKLNNQFVIPDLDDGRVSAMIVLSLSIEASVGARESVYAIEPKLRDAFLQVLFDHANTGGFKGMFTSSGRMDGLRLALTEVAQKLLDQDIKSVLLTDIARQDM